MLPSNRFRGALVKARKRADEYRDDESGSIIAFSLFIFFAMIIFSGIAVDMMLYENERTHIQNSTDRAVLAAANLNQTVDPKVVVQDYLAKVGVAIDLDDVHVTEVGAAPVITGRQVSINIDANFDTLLMHMVGVKQLPFSAVSEAQESVKDIEVSLVLDVSGSMGSNDKLEKMKVAAKDFVSGILIGAEDDRVSLSLVPYSTQVDAGDDLLAAMNTNYDHGFSACVNFTPSQFETTTIDHTVALEQTADFDPWNSWRYNYRNDVCRSESYMSILPWSNTVTEINDQIDDFEASGNTSIDVAVKWGAALLDPSMNAQLVALQAGGANIDPEFDIRPRPYFTTIDGVVDEDSEIDEVLKFIVVMTDGINTTQYEITDNQADTGKNYKSGPTKYSMSPSSGDVYMAAVEPGDRDGDGTSDEPWYNLSTKRWWQNPPSDLEPIDWLTFWANVTMSRFAYAEYHQTDWDADVYWDHRYVARESVSNSEKDDRLSDICTAAKANDVVVFTIGFEVTDHSADVMRGCASTPNHFYRVEGEDIEYAFASIKNQINKLKLTQ